MDQSFVAQAGALMPVDLDNRDLNLNWRILGL